MRDEDIPAPLPGDTLSGQRTSLCEEALRPALEALSQRAMVAGWTGREIAAALLALGTDHAVAEGGVELAGEALMVAMDRARMSEPGG